MAYGHKRISDSYLARKLGSSALDLVYQRNTGTGASLAALACADHRFVEGTPLEQAMAEMGAAYPVHRDRVIHLNAKFPHFGGESHWACGINLLKSRCDVCDS